MSTKFVAGNRITLLETGMAYFPALETAIDGATREIHLETYIFAADVTGQRIADALTRAARRGVAVHVLVDGFGAHGFPQGLGAGLVAAGVHLLVYRPKITWLTLRRNRLRRLHRKLVVIDARIAFVGGINIIDDMDTPGQIPPRYDYAVAVEGPLLAEIHKAARRLWLLVNWAALQKRTGDAPQVPIDATPRGTMAAALVIRDNLGHRRDIEDAYLAAIRHARHEIILASAYFLPGRRFRQALTEAAKRGVTVIVLLQGKVEYALLHYATRFLYARLLTSGIRIFEYHRSFLHAKVAVIDNHWVTVGSSNIDPFSLLLAREANILVKDGAFARGLRASLQRAMDSGAHEVGNPDGARPSIWTRGASRIAYAMVRLAIGLTHYGGQDYRE